MATLKQLNDKAERSGGGEETIILPMTFPLNTNGTQCSLEVLLGRDGILNFV